jgi:hypothetical protein
MALYNTRIALGEGAANLLGERLATAPDLDAKVRRIDTDNRMHRWEWLVAAGRLIKTDALDHSCTHDLVGHQDITWDIAGAISEFSLAEPEVHRFCAAVTRHSDGPVDLDLLDVMRTFYLAFQLGTYVMAAQGVECQPEVARLRGMASRYAALLSRRIYSETTYAW